jgi:B12 binding domain
MSTVALVELSVFERVVPLVSGYLQACAQSDPTTRDAYRFVRYTTSLKTPLDQIVREVLALDADVYGFSCYVWNMGLMRTVASAVRAARPGAHIVLGGPQVMHHAERYLDGSDGRTVVCNGEGELTFTAYLRELTEPSPDPTRVNGITFARDGQLVTTPAAPRITDLNDIPSPYLAGLFEPDYTISMLETNRGCPYHCGFCYWGAATNDRVYRFDEERVRDEIAWMAQNNVHLIYIADANWGMLARDIDLSAHIADCARDYGLPMSVYFSAAKNKPHAVTQITGILQDAGLMTSQPVSMQSLEPRTLAAITRSNIRLDAFGKLQEDLRQRRISSFIELIWPLPGETLASFKAGGDTLCRNDAQTIIAYPHLLLHNTPIYQNRDGFRLRTRPAGGGVAEAEIVIGTADVSVEEFADGMRFFYAVHALHNTRALRLVSRYLSRQAITTPAELFSGLVDYWRARPVADPLAGFVERSIQDAWYYDVGNYGVFIHHVLHGHRSEFARQLVEFVTAQPWWSDPQARALFELDVLNWPYVYSNTPLDLTRFRFEEFRLLDLGERRYTVEVGPRLRASLADHVRLADGEGSAGSVYVVDHARNQHPYMPSQSLDHNAHYCHGMIDRVENIVPVWRTDGAQPRASRSSRNLASRPTPVAI